MLLPFGKWIVVERLESESVSRGGIVLPDGSKQPAQRAYVRAVSEDYDGRARVGDVVLFSKYQGHDFKIDGVEVTILKDEEVLAKITGLPWPEPVEVETFEVVSA